MNQYFITIVLTLENLCAMGGIIYLVSVDRGWWSLLLVLFINSLKFGRKKRETSP